MHSVCEFEGVQRLYYITQTSSAPLVCTAAREMLEIDNSR